MKTTAHIARSQAQITSAIIQRQESSHMQANSRLALLENVNYLATHVCWCVWHGIAFKTHKFIHNLRRWVTTYIKTWTCRRTEPHTSPHSWKLKTHKALKLIFEKAARLVYNEAFKFTSCHTTGRPSRKQTCWSIFSPLCNNTVLDRIEDTRSIVLV